MITIGCKSLAPLCKDYEFVLNDKKQFAELIAKLVMGWSRHVSRWIKNLDPHYPDVDKATIQFQLDVLNGGDTTKIDVLSWKSLNSEKWKSRLRSFLQNSKNWYLPAP